MFEDEKDKQNNDKKKQVNTYTVSSRIPYRLYEKLRVYCDNRSITINEIIKECLKNMLEDNKQEIKSDYSTTEHIISYADKIIELKRRQKQLDGLEDKSWLFSDNQINLVKSAIQKEIKYLMQKMNLIHSNDNG